LGEEGTGEIGEELSESLLQELDCHSSASFGGVFKLLMGSNG